MCSYSYQHRISAKFKSRHKYMSLAVLVRWFLITSRYLANVHEKRRAHRPMIWTPHL